MERPSLFLASFDRRRRIAAMLLASALTLHDLEEAVGYLLARPVIVNLWAMAPPVEVAWVALTIATLAGVSILTWAGVGATTPTKTRVLQMLSAVLLINVVVPHVPAAILLGRYAPGVLTAVAVNLPIGLAALRLLQDA